MAYCQHIQKSMKKFSATFPMLKFSRQTPTLRWFFSRDSQEGLNFRLFRHFRHIGVVGGVQKYIGIKFQWVTMISSKNGGCGTSQGPTIIFSEKKSVDLNPVTLSRRNFRKWPFWAILVRNSETKSLKIVPKVPNRPSRKGLQTGH